MTTTVPNTSTSGTVGSPSPAPIATESVDNSITPANSDIIQLMSLANITVEMRNALNLLAQALSLAPDPATGRLRVLIEASTATVPVSVASVTNLAKLGAAGPDAGTMTFDAMQNAWANSVLPTIARA